MTFLRVLVGACACLLLPATAGAEIIDRILAVVGGELIMLSDVNAALRFGLVAPVPAWRDPVRAALDALVERQLELIEVTRYVPPEPDPAAVQARLAPIRARFESDAAFDAQLAQYGLTREQLELRLRDDLRIDAYLAERFDAALQPSDEETAEYYRTHEADFTRDGVLRPYDEVRADAHERLLRERRAAAVRDWLAGLRRRIEITDLYLTAAAR